MHTPLGEHSCVMVLPSCAMEAAWWVTGEQANPITSPLWKLTSFRGALRYRRRRRRYQLSCQATHLYMHYRVRHCNVNLPDGPSCILGIPECGRVWIHAAGQGLDPHIISHLQSRGGACIPWSMADVRGTNLDFTERIHFKGSTLFRNVCIVNGLKVPYLRHNTTVTQPDNHTECWHLP